VEKVNGLLITLVGYQQDNDYYCYFGSLKQGGVAITARN